MALTPSTDKLALFVRLYRLLLWVYPAEFRRRYSQEMAQTFRDCCREAHQQAGTLGIVRLWTYILYDLVVTACTEHYRASMLKFKRFFGLEKEYTMFNSLLNLDVALRTDVGRKRANNEDNMISIVPQDAQVMGKKGALFVVADGMGGHEKGEVASEMVVNIVNTTYYKDNDVDIATALIHALKDANEAVYQRAQAAGDRDGGTMGSTCIAAVLHDETVYVANVGDSRAYIVRDGHAKQISQDHSWVAEQIRAGTLTEEQARTHENRNIIFRCIGTSPEVEIDVFTEQVQDGDALVLCTDGLSNLVTDEELSTIVEQYGPQESAHHLVERANERGGPDNITAVVVRISLANAEE